MFLIANSSRILCALCTFIIAISIGCQAKESLESKITFCAELQGAFDSENQELVGLVQAMRTTGSMPRNLERSQADDSTNAALFLPSCMTADERLELLERLPWLASNQENEFNPIMLLEAAALLEKRTTIMDRYTQASDLPYCIYQVNHVYGFFGPMDYLDDTKIAVRLLTIRAYESAYGGEVDQSMKDFERCFRWVHWLSRVKKIESRFLATTLRSELFEAISSLLNEGKFRRNEAGFLYGMLLDNLTDWPADRRVLEGERAAMAHAYEGFRIGLAKKILSFDEQNILEHQGKLSDFLEPTKADLDQDEANFLKAMEMVIKASKDPFYQRINSIELARQITTSSPNLYADRFFMIELLDAQRMMARDRSLCEAWALTLAGAANLKLPNFRIAPINGREYKLEFDESQVTVMVGNPGIRDPSCPKL